MFTKKKRTSTCSADSNDTCNLQESSGKPAVAPHAHAPANGVDNEEVNKLKSELAEAKKEAAEALKAANSATAAAEKTSKDLEALEQTLAKLQKTVKVLISDLDEEVCLGAQHSVVLLLVFCFVVHTI